MLIGVEVYWWTNEEHKLCCWAVNINGEIFRVCNHIATQPCWPRPECVRFVSFLLVTPITTSATGGMGQITDFGELTGG